MGADILKGISLTIGALIAIAGIGLLGAIIKRISDEVSGRKRKAKTVLGDRETYIKKQMFEELVYIEKYKKELEQGEWPTEMDKKFEYSEPKSKEIICEITEEGLRLRPKRRFLRLKECFRKKQQPKDDTKEVKKKDNDNTKQ